MKPRSHRVASAREKAYQHVQRKILNGELRGGEALSEVALARESSCSRTPIREAINQLVAEGFLQPIHNRGVIVAQLSKPDIIHLFELREALEVYVVGKVAQKGLTAAEAQRLREVVDEPLQLVEDLRRKRKLRLDRDQMQQLLAADMAFHTLLIHSAENPRILKAINDSRLLVLAIHPIESTEQKLADIHREHQEILNAILSGSAEEAKNHVAAHVRHSLQERLDIFDDWERERSLSLSHRRMALGF